MSTLPKKISAREFVNFHCSKKQFLDKQIILGGNTWELRFYVLPTSEMSILLDQSTMKVLDSYQKYVLRGKELTEAERCIYLSSQEGLAKLKVCYATNQIFASIYDPETDTKLFPTLKEVESLTSDTLTVLYETLQSTIGEFSVMIDILDEDEMKKWMDYLKKGITPSFLYDASTNRAVFVEFLKYLVAQLPIVPEDNT